MTKSNTDTDDTDENVSQAGKYKLGTAAYANSFAKSNILSTLLATPFWSEHDFMDLMRTNWADDIWDDNTIDEMKEIRKSVPSPTNDTLMSKVISADLIEKYTSRDHCFYQVKWCFWSSFMQGIIE